MKNNHNTTWKSIIKTLAEELNFGFYDNEFFLFILLFRKAIQILSKWEMKQKFSFSWSILGSIQNMALVAIFGNNNVIYFTPLQKFVHKLIKKRQMNNPIKTLLLK